MFPKQIRGVFESHSLRQLPLLSLCNLSRCDAIKRATSRRFWLSLCPWQSAVVRSRPAPIGPRNGTRNSETGTR